MKSAVEQSDAVTDAVLADRDLVQHPPADLTPDACRLGPPVGSRRTHLRVETYDEGKLARAGCGSVVGVGQRSVHHPGSVAATYRPAKAETHLALVGKGVTFGSGWTVAQDAHLDDHHEMRHGRRRRRREHHLTAARRRLPSASPPTWLWRRTCPAAPPSAPAMC